MASRNLTEVFVLMRNNSMQNRSIQQNVDSDSERLLNRTLREAEEGMELQGDDCGVPPSWIDKLEESQYTISKVKPKLDELGSLHARHLLRPTLDEKCDEETQIEELSQEISKLISNTHRHIQCIRSAMNSGNKMERLLTKNVINYLFMALQEVTYKFRNAQNAYLRQLNSREERSNVFFETNDFSTVNLNAPGADSHSNYAVDSFDNFLQPTNKRTGVNYDEESDDRIDEYFGKPANSRLTQQQLLLFEEENSKLAEFREEEVTKIVKSVVDLHDIFKDITHMIQEQGTILDRIDYNIENTQTKVTEGYRQLHKAEMYQRKNRKMCCILILACVTLFFLLLLIFTKF